MELTPDGSRESRIDDLVQVLRQVGAPDPEVRAVSEVDDGVPELARFLLVRSLWSTLEGHERGLDHLPAAVRAMADGAARADLVTVARAATLQVIEAMLHRVDVGAEDAPQGSPGWALVEQLGDSGDYEVTERRLGPVHDAFLALAPSDRTVTDLRR